MNERIVKLFMQSVDSNYIPLPIEDHMPSWTEKFAELIVQECIGVVQKGGGICGAISSNNLKQHFFGVEE